MATTTLVVPVNVAALAVGEADTGAQVPAETLLPMADFSVLPPPSQAGPYTSTTVLAQTVPFQGQQPLLQGIYLHWALPDGLTAGSAGDAGLAFPSAPDRWLVTRIVVSTPDGAPVATTTSSWVVESDRLGPASTAPAGLFQPTVPLAADGQELQPGGVTQNYAYLGQAFGLAGWSEQGSTVSRLAPFTALGYGEPTFAAYFPNCSTVFGYYDALADLAGYDPAVSTVTYQVAGWYSDPAADPLAQPDATPASYGWSAPAGSTPTATLCAGVVDAIPWNPGAAYLDQAPNPMTVAVGASPQEAISALMAAVLQEASPGEYANAEEALNALQFGLFSRGSRLGDSLAALDEDVHGAGFAAIDAGPLWTVTTAGSGGGEVTLPAGLGAELNGLNAVQLELNDAAFLLQAMRFRLFADWCRYEVIEHPLPLDSTSVPPCLQGDPYAVQQYLQDEVDAIGVLELGMLALKGDVELRAALLAAGLPEGATLTGKAGAPRYYQPTDPVLVLSGLDVTPAQRYGNDGAGSADGTLACRTCAQVVGSVTLAAGVVAGSAQVELAAAALPQLAAQPSGAPSALLQSLLAEAFFLSPGLQPSVAAAVAAQGGSANPALLDPAGTVQALQAAAAAFLAGTTPAGVTFGGAAPAALYYDGWSGTPWLPILLQYLVWFSPVQYLDPEAGPAAYPPGFIGSSFAFDPGTIDLQYGGAALAQAQQYVGSAILTPSATVDLAFQVGAFLEHAPDDAELWEVLAMLAVLPLLTQGLTGLTEALLMRAATLQMPVADPLLAEPLQGFVQAVNTAVGGQNAAAPVPGWSFNPIRAGLLSIKGVRLVDVFGRCKDYAPAVVVSQGLAPPAQLAAPGAAFLPPRITQPARLLFRWRAADDRQVETNASPATSPVLGWVIPNYLDRSLQIYAPAGTPLGELALSADRKRVLWTPAPGGRYPPNASLATVFHDRHADLAHFAKGIYNRGDAAFLAPFFDAVTEALTTSLAARFAQSTQQAVLAGEPLVLARATLALELAGPAVADQSWTTFQNVVMNGAAPGDAGVTDVAFPVVLGAETRLDDTLVAYWIAPSTAADYQAFHSASAPDGPPPLTLTPQCSSAGGTDVVLLLDPRGTVHATTGILPVQEVSIPPAQYAGALASLGVTFETTPVLSGSNVPAAAGTAPPMLMVQPKVSAGSWKWVTTDGTAWASTTLTDAATAQATLSYTPQRLSEGWLSLTGLSGPS